MSIPLTTDQKEFLKQTTLKNPKSLIRVSDSTIENITIVSSDYSAYWKDTYVGPATPSAPGTQNISVAPFASNLRGAIYIDFQYIFNSLSIELDDIVNVVLYYKEKGTFNPNSTDVRRFIQTFIWNETTITYAQLKANEGALLGNIPNSADISLNITTFVREIIAGTYINRGIALTDSVGIIANQQWWSKEAPIVDDRPRLLIQYQGYENLNHSNITINKSERSEANTFSASIIKNPDNNKDYIKPHEEITIKMGFEGEILLQQGIFKIFDRNKSITDPSGTVTQPIDGHDTSIDMINKRVTTKNYDSSETGESGWHVSGSTLRSQFGITLPQSVNVTFKDENWITLRDIPGGIIGIQNNTVNMNQLSNSQFFWAAGQTILLLPTLPPIFVTGDSVTISGSLYNGIYIIQDVFGFGIVINETFIGTAAGHNINGDISQPRVIGFLEKIDFEVDYFYDRIRRLSSGSIPNNSIQTVLFDSGDLDWTRSEIIEDILLENDITEYIIDNTYEFMELKPIVLNNLKDIMALLATPVFAKVYMDEQDKFVFKIIESITMNDTFYLQSVVTESIKTFKLKTLYITVRNLDDVTDLWIHFYNPVSVGTGIKIRPNEKISFYVEEKELRYISAITIDIEINVFYMPDWIFEEGQDLISLNYRDSTHEIINECFVYGQDYETAAIVHPDSFIQRESLIVPTAGWSGSRASPSFDTNIIADHNIQIPRTKKVQFPVFPAVDTSPHIDFSVQLPTQNDFSYDGIFMNAMKAGTIQWTADQWFEYQTAVGPIIGPGALNLEFTRSTAATWEQNEFEWYYITTYTDDSNFPTPIGTVRNPLITAFPPNFSHDGQETRDPLEPAGGLLPAGAIALYTDFYTRCHKGDAGKDGTLTVEFKYRRRISDLLGTAIVNIDWGLTTEELLVLDISSTYKDDIILNIDIYGLQIGLNKPQLLFSTIKDINSQNNYGEKAVILDNDTITNKYQAQRLAEKIVNSGGNIIRQNNWLTPLRPQMQVGDTCLIRTTSKNLKDIFTDFDYQYISDVSHSRQQNKDGVFLFSRFTARPLKQSILSILTNFGSNFVQRISDKGIDYFQQAFRGEIQEIHVDPITSEKLYDVKLFSSSTGQILKNIPQANLNETYLVFQIVYIIFANKGNRQYPVIFGDARAIDIEGREIA